MPKLNTCPNLIARTALRASAAAAMALSVIVTPAHAASYDITGSVQFIGNGFTTVMDSYQLQAPISISRGVQWDEVNPPTSFHGRAGSGADGFGLHASTYAGSNYVFTPEYDYPYRHIFYSNAWVGVTYNDVVITGPAGAAPVQTAINFHMSGQQILGTHSPGPGHYSGNLANVSLTVQAGNNSAGGVYNQSARNGVIQPVDERDMMVGFSGNDDLQTPLFTLPVNTPFTMFVQLVTSVQVNLDYREGFIVSSLSDFGSTLRFATDRPVFDLPAGYSVNSAEAGLINNTFTTPVPEPGSAVLAALGLLTVCGWTRRRRGGSNRWANGINALLLCTATRANGRP